jgi:predicted membrane protein
MTATDQPACAAAPTVEVPPQPDLRQSFSHTLLAAAFILLGVTNPFAPRGVEAAFHSWMMWALVVVVTFSWSFLVRRWLRWRRLPAPLRARVVRSPEDLRQRAVSHVLMALLSLLLSGFALLGRLEVLGDDGPSAGERLLLGAGGVVGIGAVAVVARCVRDLLALRRSAARKP